MAPFIGAKPRPMSWRALTAIYRKKTAGASERALNTLRANGIDDDYFATKRSKVNGKIKQALKTAAEHYLVKSYGRPPLTRAGLSLPRNAIQIIGD